MPEMLDAPFLISCRVLDRYVADAKLHIQEGAADHQDVDGMTARAMPLESHVDLPWNVG